MLKKITKKILLVLDWLFGPRVVFSFILIALLSTAFLPLIYPRIALAAAKDQFGLTGVATEAGLIKGGKVQTLPAVIGTIIGAALALVGVIFFVLIIFGGVQWMTAGGSEEKIKKARDRIVHAIIGLVIILAAYTLVNFIFQAFTAATLNP